MAKLPVRLRQHEHRLPEQGLIKFGIKGPEKISKRTGKPYQEPIAIEWFRFCSSDRDAIEQLAEAYGGTVAPWTNGYGRDWWQVTTQVSELRVVLPKDPLGEGTWYEFWQGNACQRRCDGETCTLPRGTQKSDPNPEPIILPCVCAAEGGLKCKPHTRLNVMLPGLDPFVGVWRLDAKGDHAKDELPAMVALVQECQERGMAFGVLRLEQRSEYGWNDRTQKRELHHYVTPVVGVAASFDALLAGDAQARALGPAGGPLALPAGRRRIDPADECPACLGDGRFGPGMPCAACSGTGRLSGRKTDEEIDAEMAADDDITDAEIVEDAMSDLDAEQGEGGLAGAGSASEPGSDAPGARPSPPLAEQWEDPDARDEAAIVEDEMRTLRSRIAMDLGSDDLRHALAHWVSKERTDSTRELNLEELRRLAKGAREFKAGRLRVELVDGKATFPKVAS